LRGSRRALCLNLQREELEALARTVDDEVIRTADDLIVAFARAASQSPPASRVQGVLISRGGRQPGLAVIGDLDEAAVVRVEELFDQVEESLRFLRYVSYHAAEHAVRQLACNLVDRFGKEELERATFVGVPRGGLIVLGMLSLALGLRHDQLGDGRASAGLVIIIDDCGLSGHRVGRTLEDLGASRVGIGLLYATSELCDAIVALEPAVEACVAGHVLQDVGRQIHGDDYDAWLARWQGQLGEDRYWIGRPEPVTFAWKEPDRSFLNLATGEREPAWQLLPSRLSPASVQPGGLQLQAQRRGAGAVAVAPDVFVAERGDHIILARAGLDVAVELDAVASTMWRSLNERATVADALDELQERYDAAREVLAGDVASLMASLSDHGFLSEGVTHPVVEPHRAGPDE
jgi:hypothetical protein